MAVKYEIEKFNRNNFSLWKMKIKVVLRKNNCLAAIEERPIEIIDDKWNEIDGNTISDLYLALEDEVLSNVAEKNTAKEIWDTYKIVRGQVIIQQNLLEEETLYSSNSGIYNGDRPHQHLENSSFTTNNIGS